MRVCRFMLVVLEGVVHRDSNCVLVPCRNGPYGLVACGVAFVCLVGSFVLRRFIHVRWSECRDGG